MEITKLSDKLIKLRTVLNVKQWDLLQVVERKESEENERQNIEGNRGSKLQITETGWAS